MRIKTYICMQALTSGKCNKIKTKFPENGFAIPWWGVSRLYDVRSAVALSRINNGNPSI